MVNIGGRGLSVVIVVFILVWIIGVVYEKVNRRSSGWYWFCLYT